MHFKPLSMTRTITWSAPDEGPLSQDHISLELTATERSILEINDAYVVCSEGLHRIHYADGDKARELIRATLTLVTDKLVEAMLSKVEQEDPLYKLAIGKVVFFPEKKESDYHDDASLIFEVGIDRPAYDALDRQLVAGVLPSEIFIDFARFC